MSKKAFTLVEVSIAGALIGLCILTAVAIIPQGLKAQNVGRMRAAAAATILYLSANAHANSKASCMDPSLVQVYLAAQPALVPPLTKIAPDAEDATRPTPTPDPTTGLTLPPADITLHLFYLSTLYQPSDIRYVSSGFIDKAPAALYRMEPSPPLGDLARRIVFSYTDGNNGATTPTNTRIITAWLLNTDPYTGRAPMAAYFLGNFVEYRP